MDIVQAKTVVDSTTGPVIMTINNTIAPTGITHIQEDEALLSPQQVRENGVFIDDVSQAHGEKQCIIAQLNDKKVIISFTYHRGKPVI